MGRNKNFLAWLINVNNKKPLYIENGFVQEGDHVTLTKANGEPANLETESTGWKDTLVKYGRNDKYMGIFRDFTVPLTFSREAAKILRSNFWGGKAYESLIYFALSKLDRTSTATKYDPWFYGELDFSQYKQKKDTVGINVLEGGMSKYLKAFESTTYELPIGTNPLAVNVYMDGLPFTNRIEYSIFDQPQTIATVVYAGMGIVANEGSTQGIVNQDQNYATTGITFPNELWFMKSYSKTVTVTVSGTINFTQNIAGSHFIRVRFRKVANSTAPGAITEYNIVSAYYTPGSYSANYSITIPLIPEDAIYLICDSGPDLMSFWLTGGNVICQYDVIFTPTIIKAIRGEEVLAQLTNKMSGGLFQSSSSALRNLNDLVFTSGTAIRGNADSTLKLTTEDFNKAIKPFGLGMGIKNNMLIVEEMSYFFQQQIILSLGIVDDLTVDVANDKIFNTIKAGYRNNTYDNVNGTDEFNVTHQSTTLVTKVVREMDLVSSMRADMYGIELARLNLNGKTTTDSKSDNEPFILNINKTYELILGISNVYRLYRRAYDIYAGLLKPLSAFNIEFSPKRMLLKWQKYWNSIYDRQAGMTIRFQSGEKNSDLITSLGILPAPAEIISEKADLFLGNDKLFLPYYFSFKTEVPFNYLRIMDANPYGLIEFEYEGILYNGFMVDGGIKPATNDVQTWKLLAGPLNDMNKFI